MNKDSIYKLIGYNGEYNSIIKKRIRKLLKENHPDNKGNAEYFKLINEVKKELENNKVSYKKEKKSITNKNIDSSHCIDKIRLLKNKLAKKEEEIDIIKKSLISIDKEYKQLFNESLEKENFLLSKKYNMKLKKIKNTCIFFLILLIITFFIAIFNNNIYILIIFIIISFILLMELYKLYAIFQELTKNNNRYVHEYVAITRKLNDIRNKKAKKEKELYEKKRELELIENDLRFYNNILNED